MLSFKNKLCDYLATLIMIIIVAALLSSCAGMTPMALAIKADDPDAIDRVLLDNGANINEVNSWTWTPLHHASYLGKKEAIKHLLSKGANINATDSQGDTPLHLAVLTYDRIDIVKILLDKGADATIKNKFGYSPAQYAGPEGNKEIYHLIIKAEHKQLLAQNKAVADTIAFKMNPYDASLQRTQAKDIIPKKILLSNTSDTNNGVFSDFGHYHALVIGNNQYQHLSKLETASSDAEAVADVLKNSYGFQVKLLIDAKREDIINALASLRETLTKKDNLLIYYAGHGWLDREGDEGYWLPVDATKESELNWISNAAITTTLRAMEAKHVLVVADSCYSGKLARGINIPQRSSDYFSKMANKRARSILASGGLEPVIDGGGKGNHSVFASAFIETLKENMVVMGCHVLFTRLRRPVILNSDQSPEYGDISKAGHDGGEFIFVRQEGKFVGQGLTN